MSLSSPSNFGSIVDLLGFMASVQGHLDHAGAGLADDFEFRQFGLRLFHGLLHLLRLAHQIPNPPFIMIELRC